MKINKPFFYFIFYLFPIFNFGQEIDTFIYTLDSLYLNENYPKIISYKGKTLNSKVKQADANFIFGKAYESLNKEDSAFIYFQKALETFKSNDLDEKIAKTNFKIYVLLSAQKDSKLDEDIYLNDLKEYAKQTGSKKWSAIIDNNLGIKKFNNQNPLASKKHFFNAYNTFRDLDTLNPQIQVLSNIGLLYAQKIKKTDSARYFFNKGLVLFESDTTKNKILNDKYNLLSNYGNSYMLDRNYKKAIEYYKEAEKIDLKRFNLKSKRFVYSNIQASYYYLNNFYGAYDYLYKYDSIKDIIKEKEQNTKIANVKEELDNEKLRADNLVIEAKRKQNQNLLFGALGLLLFGAITAFLIQKNTKRKQLIAEKEKELQIQKVSTILKEQELTSIDAMIEGQEKERQRIANDLHDDLGGLMATVKLHFNALKEKQTPELFDKTNTLLDDAYQKIRTIAHAKNSGVIAKQGLLKAVEEMAEKISQASKIKIEVIDHGLENRLENSLELTIFRIIQELTTNVIKHANATLATIHLTNHDNSLNIMIEDNGIGFNQKKITSKKGMGINSIDKRVEHLDGKMTIESEKNRGTTVIIDIPI